MPNAVQAAAPAALRHVSPQQDVAPAVTGPNEAQGAQTGVQTKPVAQLQPLRIQPQPVAQLNAKANLFAEAQRPMTMHSPPPGQTMSDPARPSLFNAVTGAFRRRTGPIGGSGLQPQQMRGEPVMQEYQPQSAPVSIQQTSPADQTGIEIPAFLRRQHSS
jgi:hypothetical protein